MPPRDIVVTFQLALCLVLLFASNVLVAQSNWHPCGRPLFSSFNYPVIVYDAQTRTAVLAYKSAVDTLIAAFRNQRTPIPANAIQGLNTSLTSPGFLCYGIAVEVYILNRRLKTSFTVSLTAAIQSNTGRPEISGYSQAVGATAPPTTAPPTTPTTKGFTPVATATNLLTTDQIIGYFLNEETFDRPVSKIMDDAAAVVAQANQLRASYEQYRRTLNSITGPAPLGDEGNLTVQTVTSEFNRLSADVQARTPDEKLFDDWTERADRLQTDVTRINTKLQTYPFVDILTNIRASAATVNDNVRGVRNEFVSLALAKRILLTLIEEYHATENADRYDLPPYLKERAQAEIRSMLRSQYPASTVDEQTLARIVDSYRPSVTRWLALRERLVDLRIDGVVVPWIREINQALTANAGAPDAFSLCGEQSCLADFRPTDSLQPLTINLSPAITQANGHLEQLRAAIRAMNGAEARALQSINDIYDRTTASYQVLNLNLTGYGKNLFVHYAIGSSPGFYRYQIINETPQPQSACALAVSANTSASGGALTCTTSPTSLPPPASASFAASVPASAVAQAGAAQPGAATQPANPSQSATAAATPSSSTSPQPSSGTTGPSANASPCPVDFCGTFEQHRFTNAALITGVTYDSIPNQSFSWFTCPTSPTLPNGNPSSSVPGCISPTTPAGATTPSPTYYELLQTRQPFIGAVQGINIYILPQDTFTTHRNPGYLRFIPDVFLGASVYPLNHYFAGLSEEGLLRGLSISGGLAYGSQDVVPSNFPYKPGTVVTAAPTLSTSTRFQKGFFLMVGFHTSLFKAIFSGSAFQNTSIGTAGAPPATAGQPSSQ